jgi:flagellar hook assembly protein FlgD
VQVFKGFWNLAASVTPNPFNPEAKLSFETGKAGALRVRLYDLHGRLVRTLVNEANAAAGSHEYRIDGRADDGTRLPSGTYFFRIEAAGERSGGQLTLLK